METLKAMIDLIKSTSWKPHINIENIQGVNDDWP